jgi:hypothetical protein
MCLNGIELSIHSSLSLSLSLYIYIYIVTIGMHRMIYVEIYARRTYMPMSLNETEHTYIIMARLHIMIYM